MSSILKGILVLCGSYAVAVFFAWKFSGTYLSAATSLPWALAGGLVGGWLLCRE